MGMGTPEPKPKRYRVPGSPWIDIRDEHPPLNGTPVLLCFEKEVSFSHVHVGRYRTNATGAPMLVCNGLLGFDLPKVLYWREDIQLPWNMGHSKPVSEADPM